MTPYISPINIKESCGDELKEINNTTLILKQHQEIQLQAYINIIGPKVGIVNNQNLFNQKAHHINVLFLMCTFSSFKI